MKEGGAKGILWVASNHSISYTSNNSVSDVNIKECLKTQWWEEKKEERSNNLGSVMPSITDQAQSRFDIFQYLTYFPNISRYFLSYSKGFMQVKGVFQKVHWNCKSW